MMTDKSTIKVRIKLGAPVFQDFRFFRWSAGDIVFDLQDLGDGRADLTAPGYGRHDGSGYGNGSIGIWRWRQCVEILDA